MASTALMAPRYLPATIQSKDRTEVVLRRRAALLPAITRMARVMDSAFRVPLLGWRVGVDGLLGLIPGVGDLLSLFLSLEMVRRVAKAGGPRRLLLRMGVNLAADFAIGTVPILGDLADMGFKANTRNVALVEKWLESVDD